MKQEYAWRSLMLVGVLAITGILIVLQIVRIQTKGAALLVWCKTNF